VNLFVLDASVAVAWVAGASVDPYALTIQARVQSGWKAVVPSLWQPEVANGLLMLERRAVLTSTEANQGLLDLETFLASLAQIDQTSATIRQLANLARFHQLTVYDAVYLELAQRQGLPLATLDKSLKVAAAKAGISLLT
jgi:predicted nucleic acid-binding protein